MVVFVIQENKKYYDIETMRQILNVSKSKIHRQLKKQHTEIVKYKNLHLYNENSLFNLMEIILIEKLENMDD